MNAQKIFEIAGPIGGLAAIGAVVAAILTFLMSKQASQSREEMRKLKIALERDPSQAQLSQALALWPAAGQYPATQQLIEFRKQALNEESRRADRVEQIKGVMRFFAFVAFLGIAIYVSSLFLGKKPENPQSASALGNSFICSES